MTFLQRMVYLVFLAALSIAIVTPSNGQEFKSHEYYISWCEANPNEPACIPRSLGGLDSLERERMRENEDGYYELDDDREYLGQDMEDPRDSL